MAIYVEIRIRGSMEELWRLTQTPEQHARWDLRFTDIEYLPRLNEAHPQRFVYATRIGLGLAVKGNGETAGRSERADGERVSALKFWTNDPKSLIRKGAGYWRYVPTADGVRFLTSYDYRVRFGALGRIIDKLVFRPLLGWATAWSFDRLRLWMEKGIDPAVALRCSLVHLIARAAITFVWLYQGVVPKLLGPHADELTMIHNCGVSSAIAPLVANLLGWAEVVFGLTMMIFIHQRWHFLMVIVLMIAATAGVAIQSPQFLSSAFNPVSFNLSVIALASVGLIASRDVPCAAHCLRRRPLEET